MRQILNEANAVGNYCMPTTGQAYSTHGCVQRFEKQIACPQVSTCNLVHERCFTHICVPDDSYHGNSLTSFPVQLPVLGLSLKQHLEFPFHDTQNPSLCFEWF